MEKDNEIIFEVMVIYVEVLEEKIKEYNHQYGTDFVIVEIIDDDVIICKIKVSKYKISDVYYLGYGLSVLEYKLRAEGKIDW